MIARKYYK